MNTEVLSRFRGRVQDMGEQAMEAAEQAQDDLVDRVLALRRALADRIDPDPAPRRLRRWMVVGSAVILIGVFASAMLAWRHRRLQDAVSSNGQHPSPEHASPDPTVSSAGNGVAAEAR
jgi:hypothetical protein